MVPDIPSPLHATQYSKVIMKTIEQNMTSNLDRVKNKHRHASGSNCLAAGTTIICRPHRTTDNIDIEHTPQIIAIYSHIFQDFGKYVNKPCRLLFVSALQRENGACVEVAEMQDLMKIS